MSKKKVVAVVVDKAEGPTDLCGPKTVSSLAEANAILRRNAETAPKGGAYDKHDFTITFEDGEKYQGRIDIHHPDSGPRYKNETIGEHVTWHCRFHGGLLSDDEIPKHIGGPERYRQLVEEFRRGIDLAQYRVFLENYDLSE